MNKLKVLLESELLNDDVKSQLSEAIEAMKAEYEGKVQAEYAEKLISEMEKLDSEIKEMVIESVEGEISELKEDISRYRKLEIEYAEKLEEFKETYQKELSESVNEFVKTIVEDELSELKDDLKESKKLEFGKRMFEAFSEEFVEHGFGGDMKQIHEELSRTKRALEEAKENADKLLNEKVKENLLSNLSGKKRSVMATILEGVSTDSLESKYNSSIEFVLESDEGKDSESNNPDESSDASDGLSESEKQRLNKLLGKKL